MHVTLSTMYINSTYVWHTCHNNQVVTYVNQQVCVLHLLSVCNIDNINIIINFQFVKQWYQCNTNIPTNWYDTRAYGHMGQINCKSHPHCFLTTLVCNHCLAYIWSHILLSIITDNYWLQRIAFTTYVSHFLIFVHFVFMFVCICVCVDVNRLNKLISRIVFGLMYIHSFVVTSIHRLPPMFSSKDNRTHNSIRRWLFNYIQ